MICYLYPEPSYFFFISDAPGLLYYSHIPAALLALFIGFFIYLNNPRILLNKLLLVISLCFASWTFVNLVLWTNIHSDFLLFLWPFLGVFSSLISIFSIYFTYVFLEKKDITLKLKTFLFLLVTPVLIFAPTNLSVTGFNITNCDAFGYEGTLFKFYYIALGIIALIWIPIILFRKYLQSTSQDKKQILLMGFGLEFFLFSFFTMTFIASYLAGIGYLEDSRLEMYGLFGMTVFIVFIGILMAKFKTFSIGLIASQGLVVALIVLVGSQLTYINSKTGIVLSAITLILTGVVGVILIRTIKKDAKQKEQIEKLAVNLKSANIRLKQVDKLKSEFVSIASHQLRSPITSISGYASLIREGNYGEVTTKMKEPLERIEQSARMMASSIEDYLNVSRIESGYMKYNNSDFNLAEEVEHVSDDLRSEALKSGLILLFKKRLESKGIVNADIGKIQQIIHNLINNAIKYTPKGTITVFVQDNLKNKLITVDVLDTGIGMDEETLHSIFQKFERGDKANAVNVKGTGLGLYVALKMTEAMHGRITAYSEGEGKGSRFTVELPLQM